MVWVSIVIAFAAAALPALAGMDEDTVINYVTNTTSYVFGDTGAGHKLVVTNNDVVNGQIINAGAGIIGNASTAHSNVVIVTGAGQRWDNTGTLTIGSSGAGNTLIVENGGVVVNNNNGAVGLGAGASNNTVIVSGAGSVWSPWNAMVGSSGAANHLTISNGGSVVSGGICTVGEGANATNNTVTITGTGSLWTIAKAKALKFGYKGAGNALVITDGGTLNTDAAWIGRYDNDVGYPSSNTVTVTGAGSVWTNTGGLSIGCPATLAASGTGNVLNVHSGGTAVMGGTVTLRLSQSVFNLGDGVGVSTASVAMVSLSVADARLNLNSGLLAARADGALISGLGVVSNIGPAYVSTDFASSIDCEIAGSGSLTKLGNGTLTLGGTNTYSGETIVSAGTLAIMQPYLNDTGTVRVAAGAALGLNFAGIDKIGGLYWNDVPQPQGLYGAGALGGTISGNGFLRVTAGPPGSGASLTLK